MINLVQNPRRQFIINPGFQLKFSLLVTLAIMVFNIPTPLFIITLIDVISESNKSLNLQQLLNTKWQIFLFFLVVEVVFLSMAFMIALYHSHKIAGPLFKLKKAMISLRQGVYNQNIRFRAKDNFTDLADEFNAMADSIFERRRRDYEYVNSVIPKLENLAQKLDGENKETLNESLNALRELSKGTK